MMIVIIPSELDVLLGATDLMDISIAFDIMERIKKTNLPSFFQGDKEEKESSSLYYNGRRRKSLFL
jgi:hypothetical protein